MCYFFTFSFHCIVNVMKLLYNYIEVIIMQKDSTISLRIDSELKKDVENILNSLGIPMTTAITMYFNQIRLNNGIPFTPSIPKPKAYEDYTDEELYTLCENGAKDLYNKKTTNSVDFEKQMKEKMKRGL